MVPQGYTLKGRHMRGVRDFSPEEIWQVLWTARDIKSRLVTGEQMKILEGCTLAMIFQKPSLRTRVSFEVGMNQLGGKALYLGPEEIKIGKRETTEDIATVLSGFCDGIMARVFGHNIIEDLAKYAHVPVINALCDYEHPCQAMGDTMTIWERRGRLVVASPEGFELKRDVLELAKKDVKDFNTKGSVEITNDPMKACKDADVVYTDVWASMGQEAEQEERKKKFAGFMVTEKMLDQAHHDVMLMHCLPAHYNEEIAAGLNHDRRCSFYPQAENRLHAQKGLMALIMRKR
jgi:ornithine carbamoyltransferase